MKIIFIGDNHIYFGNQHKAVIDMMEKIRDEKPDVVCNVGDVGEVLMSDDTTLIQELFSIQPTLWIPGNHDLYSRQKYTPPEAMEKLLGNMSYGIPLQTNWTDAKTVYEKDGVLFLGTMGLCDFAHPKMLMPTKYYDSRCCTIDGSYINLEAGFIQYATPLLDAFEKKLQLVDKSKCKNVVILSHYPGYTSQYKLSFDEEVSAYFYCHRLGLMISKTASKNPDKKFYFISGHGHEYMTNLWLDLTDNLKTFGLVTTYTEQIFEALEI